MPRSFASLTLLALAILLGSAAALSYLVIDGIRPIDRSAFAAASARTLPPLPKVGLPGAVAPEGEFLEVSAKTAEEINASRPFASDKIILAAPFVSSLAASDEERAIACLATAALYEAGGNSSDQSAVMQVVLNRVRHPAFPKTVCGVIFQGAERSTGCQFSFTCDGSMQRWRPGSSSWREAIGLARAMLSGYVDRRVGLATHYHTNWVVPYWSASLEKIAAVRTHLFFRWPGYWGKPAAFRYRPATKEPAISSLAAWFPAHAAGTTVEEATAESAPAVPLAAIEDRSSAVQRAGSLGSNDMVTIRRLALPAEAGAARWAVNALNLCNDVPVCRVVGWSEPLAEPSEISRSSLTASPPDLVFIKIARNRQQQAYWDCTKWPRVSGSECLGAPTEIARLLYAE